MFAWCFTMISMAITMLTTSVQNGACVRKRRKIGIDAALTIEASETNRVERMTIRKTSKPPATAIGSIARKAPAAVATPFPP